MQCQPCTIVRTKDKDLTIKQGDTVPDPLDPCVIYTCLVSVTIIHTDLHVCMPRAIVYI